MGSASVSPSRDLGTEKPVLVTGTPRAGSSLIGQLLEGAGVFLGDDFLPPRANDPSGVRCHRGLVDLNDGILEANDHTWYDCDSTDSLAVSETDGDRCRELLATKFQTHSSWGWVDPRAALLLRLWDTLLPQASWIFVIRSPEASVWSMLVSGVLASPDRTLRSRARDLAALWNGYASRLLEFAHEHPEKVHLVFTPADFSLSARARLAARLSAAASAAVTETAIEAIYDRFLLRLEVPPWLRRLIGFDRRIKSTCSRLEKLRGGRATLGPSQRVRAPVGSDSDRPRVCLFSSKRFAVSESFIRDHLNYLPAEMFHLYGMFGKTKRTEDGLGPSGPWDHLARYIPFRVGRDPGRRHWRRIARYLKRNRVEAAVAEYGHIGAEWLPVCSEIKIPLIVHFHGFDAYKESHLTKHAASYAQLFEGAAAIIAVSKEMVRQLEGLGAPAGKVHLNPCGVDLTRFRLGDPQSAPPVFLAVGRFVDKKGPQLTLLAFRELLNECPDARLVMVGDGVLRPACRHMAAALKLGDAVSFPGARPHTEVVTRMQNARAFVQHSLRTFSGDSEGTPVAVMEAGASGLPVVATEHAGISEVVIHEHTGLLVEEGDVEGMARHMIAVARDPALAAEMGRRAREHVSAGYDLMKTSARLGTIVRNAISSTAGSRRDV